MNRLYEKSLLWHALLWIFVYVFGASVCSSLGKGEGIKLVFHAVLTLALALWIGRNGLKERFGLCRARFPARRFLWYIPLILIPCVNLAGGLCLNDTATESLFAALSMALVGFLEEVIFRGLLFRALRPNGVRRAMIISAATFGLGHLVNLFNGSGGSPFSTGLQVLYAVALGFVFVALFERGGSLWPAILTHSAIDILSVFASEKLQGRVEIVLSVFLILVSAAYAFYLLKKLPPREE